jgi:hypothetical protein
MNELMRTLLSLCVLLVVTGSASAFQATTPSPKNAALPPDPPPPLYLPTPSSYQEIPRLHEPLTEDEIEQLLRARARDSRPVGTQGDASARAAGVQQPQPTDEFKPISEVPPEDRLPAAPMLVGAYAFVMLAIFAYVISLSRRLNAVARDLARFESQAKRP